MSNEREIKKVFLKLLDTRSLDSINVSLICDEISIKRQTFYYHYRDIYDLVDSILNDYATDLINKEINTYYLIRLIDFVNENNNFFYSCISGGLKDLLIKFFTNLLIPYVSKEVNSIEESNTLGNKDIREIVNYHVNGITIYLLGLINQEDIINSDHFVNKIKIFLDKEILAKTALLYFQKRREI